MKDKKKIIIISDDYYYLHGIAYLMKGNNIFDPIYVHFDSALNSSFLRKIFKDHSPENSVIFLALDSYHIVKNIPEFDRRTVVCSLRCSQENHDPFSFYGVLFVNRHIDGSYLINLLNKISKGNIVKDIFFTKNEESVIFNYFNCSSKSYIQALLNVDEKRISYHKRTVYEKIRVNSDSCAFHIIKAINYVYSALLKCHPGRRHFIATQHKTLEKMVNVEILYK